ncbi:MAG: pantetheine-phosphate adenylyltransferase [Pseudomonadota bacterium]
MTQSRTGFYSGSFDPITNGHLDVLRTSLMAFDQMIIGVGIHAGKKGLFSHDERLGLIQASLNSADVDESRVKIVTFDNLVIDAAANAGAHVIVRGLRDATDFAYEMQMAGMNGQMAPDLPTIFMPASADTRPISATLVRQIAAMGGDVTSFVPAPVAEALANLNK